MGDWSDFDPSTLQVNGLGRNSELLLQGCLVSAAVLLGSAEKIPMVGCVAVVLKKFVDVCEDNRNNKVVFSHLKQRVVTWSGLLYADGGIIHIAVSQNRTHDQQVIAQVENLKEILEHTIERLSKYTKRGFLSYMLKSKKPGDEFAECDSKISGCINNLSLALSLSTRQITASTYEAVNALCAKFECHEGGLQALSREEGKLAELAAEIGCEVSVLRCELQDEFARMAAWRNTVDSALVAQRETSGEQFEYLKSALHDLQTKHSRQTDLAVLQLPGQLHVNLNDIIGEGGFSNVYRGTYMNKPVAVKQPKNLSAEAADELCKEVLMHAKFANNLGVVRLIGVDMPRVGPKSIVLELGQASLHDALHHGAMPDLDLSPSGKLGLLVQVASTMEYISALGLIHRDIKSSNVLIFSNSAGSVDAKLCDFGIMKNVYSVSTFDATHTPKGTPPYMAPEVMSGTYSTASDVYAFAVMVNEVFSDQRPFHGINSHYVIMNMVNNNDARPELFQCNLPIASQLTRLVTRNWDRDVRNRSTFAEISRDLDSMFRQTVETIQCGRQQWNEPPKPFKSLKPFKPSPEPLTSPTYALYPPVPPLVNPRATHSPVENDNVRTMREWLETYAELTHDNASTVAHTLYTSGVGSMEKASRRVAADPKYLEKLGITDFDEADILDALSRANFVASDRQSVSSPVPPGHERSQSIHHSFSSSGRMESAGEPVRASTPVDSGRYFPPGAHVFRSGSYSQRETNTPGGATTGGGFSSTWSPATLSPALSTFSTDQTAAKDDNSVRSTSYRYSGPPGVTAPVSVTKPGESRDRAVSAAPPVIPIIPAPEPATPAADVDMDFVITQLDFADLSASPDSPETKKSPQESKFTGAREKSPEKASSADANEDFHYPHCVKMHKMALTPSAGSWSCALCATGTTSSKYSCLQCNEHVCTKCFDAVGGGGSVPLCPEDHPMPFGLYWHEGLWFCDSCYDSAKLSKVKNMHGRFFCEECEHRMCLKCFTPND